MNFGILLSMALFAHLVFNALSNFASKVCCLCLLSRTCALLRLHHAVINTRAFAPGIRESNATERLVYIGNPLLKPQHGINWFTLDVVGCVEAARHLDIDDPISITLIETKAQSLVVLLYGSIDALRIEIHHSPARNNDVHFVRSVHVTPLCKKSGGAE